MNTENGILTATNNYSKLTRGSEVQVLYFTQLEMIIRSEQTHGLPSSRVTSTAYGERK